MPSCLSSASSIILPGKPVIFQGINLVMITKSAIVEFQQEQALQNCECQSNGGYQSYQTAFWRLQGLSEFNESDAIFYVLNAVLTCVF